MRYTRWSKGVLRSAGFAQVQAVNGGEVQMELETCEAYHPDARRGHARVVHADWHKKHADGEENEQAFEIQTLDRRGRLPAGRRPDCRSDVPKTMIGSTGARLPRQLGSGGCVKKRFHVLVNGYAPPRAHTL